MKRILMATFAAVLVAATAQAQTPPPLPEIAAEPPPLPPIPAPMPAVGENHFHSGMKVCRMPSVAT